MSSPCRHPLPPVLLLVATAVVLLGQSSSASQAPQRSSRFIFSDPLTIPAQLPEEGRAVKRVRYVEVNLGLLAEPGATSLSADTAARLVELNLFPDVFLIALLDNVESVAPGSFSWVGSINGMDLSSVSLVVHDGILAGSIGTLTASYEIRYIGGSLYAIREVEPDQLPPELPPIPVPPSGQPPPGPPWPDSGDVFDVLVVYTPLARVLAGGTSAINSLIDLGVTDTNRALDNSGLGVPRLRLVRTAEIQYTESGSISTDLQRLQGTSDGFMDDVHALRDSVRADLVQLVSYAFQEACGIAYLMAGVDPEFASRAFSVTSYQCIAPLYTFAHELGHSMGSNHAPDDPVGQGAFDYSFGYKDPGFFRTVMAYDCLFFSCPRVLHFSSPVRFRAGRVTGTASQDNARSISNARFVIANFRQATGGTVPGAPSNLTALVFDSTVTLSWSPPTTGGTPTTYVVEVGSSPGASNLLNIETGSTGTSFTISGVSAGTHYARVRARNSGGTGPPSNEATFARGGLLAPGPPSNLATSVSGSTVTLRWSAPTTGGAPTTYVVEAGSSSGASNILNRETGSTLTSFTLSGVGSGTHYARVRARNSAGSSGASNEVTFTGGGTGCVTQSIGSGVTMNGSLSDSDCASPRRSPARADLYTFSGSAGTQVSIAMDRVTLSDPYLYLVGPSGSVLAQDDDSGGNLNALISNYSLPSSGTYTIEATSFVSTDRGSYTVRLDVVTTGAPGAPSNLQASVSGTTVTLTWSAPTTGGAPTTYVLQAGSSPGASNLLNITTGSTATSYTVINFPSGTSYVRVRARNGAGTSAPSNEVTVVVGCVPSAPTGLVAAISGSTVTLSWNAASGATSYVIEAGSAPGASNLAIIDTGGTATTFTAANVPPGAYFVRVRARNSCGLSGPSNELLIFVL